jgi:acetyltransferase-like isoleucine patch superfamily enzyme
MIRDFLRRWWLRRALGTKVYKWVNLYPSAQIGRDTIIGSYSEIGEGVVVGDRCKLGAYVFLPKGVTVGNEVFIAPGVRFTNDKYPKAVGEWKVYETTVADGVSIGAGSTIICGVTLGKNCKIGAGSVVTKDVAPGAIVYGVPAIEHKSKPWSDK